MNKILTHLLLLLVVAPAMTGCNGSDNSVDYTEYYSWRDRNNVFMDRLRTSVGASGAATYFADSVRSLSEPYSYYPTYYHVLEAADEETLRAKNRWFTPFYTSTLKTHYTLYNTKSVLNRLDNIDLTDKEAVEAVFTDGKTETIQECEIEFYESFTPASVIVGWGDVLQQMHEGDSWIVAIPWYLAYGQKGSTNIDPYSDLFFHIQLVEITWWGGTVE
jgi:hypothetical protein